MKRAGLYILHDGPFLRECEWLRRNLSGAIPGLPVPGAVAVDRLPQLLEALAAQIKQYDLFVVAAEPRQFHSLKTQLLEALGLPARVNESVAALQKRYPEDTMFPSGVVPFVTPEARYNGFAMRCGRQHMLVLPLRLDLLESMAAKLGQYLHRAAGSRVIPMPQAAPSVETMLAQMGGYGNHAPISPEAIVPWAAMQQGEAAYQASRRARELLRRLADRNIACDLLLPPAWAGVADFLRGCGGGVISPMFLPQRQAAGHDASSLIKRRMRAAGCKFCGMVTPPALDGSHTVVALAGPGQYARMRRMELHTGDNVADVTVELLTLLSEYRDARQARAGARRVTQAVAAGMAALVAVTGLMDGTRRLDGTQAREMSYSRMQAGDVIRLDSALLYNAVPVESEASIVSSALLQEAVFEEKAPAGTQESLIREEESQAPEEQAAPLLSVNPLETAMSPVTASSLSFGGVLKGILNWLLGLIRSIPDKIFPPERETTTKPGTTTTATTISTTVTASTARPAAQGTYGFAVAGYGHGVGMSQEGAKVLAAQGWDHERILKHYYPGVAVSNDTGRPASVKHGGATYELKEYLARVAYAEIGRCGVVADEAIKAQMICAYTMAKRRNYNTTDVDQVLLPAADWNSNFAKQFHAKMLALASAVLGKYVTFNGGTAETLYFASCAGYTASAQYAWGGNAPAAYLAGGRTSPETIARSYPTFTTEQVRAFVNAYNAKYPAKAITLGADASQWIKVLRTDANGYVEQIQIGNRTLTGGEARMQVFGSMNVRSHNFTVSFTAR